MRVFLDILIAVLAVSIILVSIALITGDSSEVVHVEIAPHTLALSVLLQTADQHDRCEEDELWWFTGDYDGTQWTRACVPMDRMVQ